MTLTQFSNGHSLNPDGICSAVSVVGGVEAVRHAVRTAVALRVVAKAAGILAASHMAMIKVVRAVRW